MEKNRLNLTFKNYNLKLFLLIVFLIPFTDTNFLPLPGEFSTDLALNFTLVLVVFQLLISFINGKYRVVISTPLSILYLFMIWCLLSAFINLNNIFYLNFKGRQGFLKLVWQGFILVFLGFFFTNYLMKILKKIKVDVFLRKIRRAVLASYSIVFLYCFFEYLYSQTNNSILLNILSFFDAIFFLKHPIVLDTRLSSIMHEPPFLAIYLVFATPWIFSYMFNKSFLIALSPLLLGFLSGSRTSFIITLIQFSVFIFYYIKIKYGAINLVKVSIGLSLITIFFYGLNFSRINNTVSEKIEVYKKDSKKKNQKIDISNVSRWGTQAASYRIWKDNPILGVGFAQQGFYLKDYYSKQDYKNSYEIRFWSDTNYPTWPPGFSLYTRLLAETGIVGFLLIIIFLFTMLNYSFRCIKMASCFEQKILALVLFVTNLSFIINYFQFDSFRLVSFWITLALTLTFYNFLKTKKNYKQLNNY